MNPIYKFVLNTVYGGTTTANAVYPLYKNDLAKEYEIEQNERFYRAKLNGKLQFIGPDYDLINNADFETQFVVIISISWDAGQTWAEYWRGEFWKTDCKINSDNKTIEVTPAPVDDYTAVLAGMEKEYNLIDLKPEIHQLNVTKRPLVQVYVPGESIISCFLSNMFWEQDCEAVDNENDLVNTYHFAKCDSVRIIDVTPSVENDLPSVFWGTIPGSIISPMDYTNKSYRFTFEYSGSSGNPTMYWRIYRVSNGVKLWEYGRVTQFPPTAPYEVKLQPVSGSGATGTVRLYIHDQNVYARLMLDLDWFLELNTYQIPSNDLVGNNRNYRRVIGWSFPQSITFYDGISSTPTEWGIKVPGQYYTKPVSLIADNFFPVGRSHWGALSIWFTPSYEQTLFEIEMQKHYVLRDANPLYSVISVLLSKIAPGITHEATTEYSQFLYGQYNPISYDRWYLYLTQKSNILAGDYQQPAQNAPITLKMITDMLRNCFCAYWYIEDGKFKIEHIKWFKNGGRYSGTPIVSHDLTVEKVTRNGKEWAFETSQYEYDKPTMPERYQFGWMDEVTSQFRGMPIEVVSKFVQAGNIEEITVNNFTSDIDYMLLNPAACSLDGFAIMAAVPRIPWDGMNFTKVDGKLRTDKLPITSSTLNITISGLGSNAHYRIVFYNGNAIVAYSSWGTTSRDYPVTGNMTHAAFEFENTDGTEISYNAWILYKGGVIGLINHIPVLQVADQTIVQNPYLAFPYLQNNYYGYDLPAYNVIINGQQSIAYGIQRNKKQSIKFPVGADPDPLQLIKTNIGNGQIQKISINLSNRNANATLMYDTY